MVQNQNNQDKFDLLCELLIEENAKYNLTRIVSPEEIRVRHFQDSLIIADWLECYKADDDVTPCLIDLGSGAGFPSLALAIEFDNWNFVSVEATGKKVAFQQMAAEKLGLTNFTVTNARAEDLGHDPKFRGKFDFATARALGHLAMIAELALPLLQVGGTFFAWKGPRYVEEMDKSGKILNHLGASEPEVMPYTLGGEEDLFHLLRVNKVENTPRIYPRSFGMIKKSLEKLK